jgi:hypothetical protein
MKRLLLLCLPILAAAPIFAQQDPQAAQKAWMDYMTPGKIHQMLAHADGKWDYDMTFWMTPEAPPAKSKGTSENKMILGGRYQESVHKGSFDGMPFEGHSILAYDNAKKIFQNTWIDNMGTGIMILEGTWDDATKAVTLTGTAVDPTDGKDFKVRQVYTLVDDNHHNLEQYCTKAGKENKVMEIKFTRK